MKLILSFVLGLHVLICIALFGFPSISGEITQSDGYCSPVPNIRAGTFIPDFYNLRLVISPESDDLKEHYKIPGSVTINGHAYLPTNTLTLHADNLKINNATVTVINGNGTVNRLPILYSYRNCQYFIIKLESGISPRDKIQIHIEYSALSCETNDCGYLDYGHGIQIRRNLNDIDNLDNIRGVGSDGVFPYFYSFDAPLKLEIVRRENQTALSNSPIQKTTKIDGERGLYMDEFQRTIYMFPEQFRFIVLSDAYSFLEWRYGDNKDVVVRLYRRKSRLPEISRFAAFNNQQVEGVDEKHVLKLYEEFYGRLDGVTKMDFVETEGHYYNEALSWGISIDNSWLRIFGYESFTKNPIAFTLLQHWQFETKEPLYLNRAINAYIREQAAKKSEETRQSEEAKWNDYYELKFSLLGEDNMQLDSWFNKQDLEPLRIKRVLNMLEDIFNPETVKHAVAAYTKKVLNGKVAGTLYDFLECIKLQAENSTEVSQVQEIGIMFRLDKFPVVKVGIFNATHVALSQERFVAERNSTTDINGMWHIPIKIRKEEDSGKFSTVKVWLKPNETVLVEHDASKIIIIDPNTYGHYRVLYDNIAFERILSQLELNPNIFNPIFRMKLIDDYFVFNKYKYVNIETILNLTRYLGKERDYHIWESWNLPVNILPLYSKLFYHPARTQFQKYIAQFIEPHLNLTEQDKNELELERCLNPSVGEPFIKNPGSQLNRAPMWGWACLASSPSCDKYVRRILKRWESNPTKSPFCLEKHWVPDKLFDAVQCKLFEVGGKRAVERALDIYRNHADTTLLPYIGCATDSGLITELFNKSLNTANWQKSRDGIKLMLGLAFYNPIAKSALLDYLSEGDSSLRFDMLRNGSSTGFTDFFDDLAEFGASNPEKVKHFFSDNNLQKFNENQQHFLKEVVQRMAKTMEWLIENGENVKRWLNMV